MQEARGDGAAAAVDGVDRQLLRALVADGRASYAALARGVGLSQAATRARVRRLLADGVVRVAAAIHPELAGAGVAAAFGIAAAGPALAAARAVAALPSVGLVLAGAGRYDVIAEVRCADDAALAAAADAVRALPGVAAAEAFRYLRIERDVLAPDGPAPGVDAVDRRLLALLAADGRAPAAELAAAVGLSETAVRGRLGRLLAERAVRVGAIVDPLALGRRDLAALGVRTRGGADAVVAHLLGRQETTLAARAAGRYDVVATVACAGREALLAELEALRGLPGVAVVEATLALAIVRPADGGARPYDGEEDV